jgi:hypothetical protein
MSRLFSQKVRPSPNFGGGLFIAKRRKMLDQLEIVILNSLQTLFDQFGWVGVFIIMILENATGITPSEIILTLSGHLF